MIFKLTLSINNNESKNTNWSSHQKVYLHCMEQNVHNNTDECCKEKEICFMF